jgi:hypothetical protein
VTDKPKFIPAPGQRARPEQIPTRHVEVPGIGAISADINVLEGPDFSAHRRFRATVEEDGGAYVEEAWLIDAAPEVHVRLLNDGLAEPWFPDGEIVATPALLAKLAAEGDAS